MIMLQFGPELPEVVRHELEAIVLQLQRQLDTSSGSASTIAAALAALQAQINANAANISALSTAAERTANKNIANGYAGLDANGNVPKSHGGYGDKYAAVRVSLGI